MQAEGAAALYQTDAYEPVTGRARATTFLLGICAAVAFFSFLSTMSQYSLVNRLEERDFSSRAEVVAAVESNDNRQAALAITEAVLTLVTGIVFIAWMWRSHKNLRPLGVTPRHGSGWAIGGWFVPFLNLVRPKQIVDDIYKGSDPDAPPNDPNWSHGSVTPLLHWWWALWLLSAFTWQVFDNSSRAASLDSLRTSTVILAISALIGFGAAVLAMVVVGKLTQRQEQRASRLNTSGELLPARG